LNLRTFKTTSFNLVSKEFEDAKVRLTSLSEDPGNEAKLKLYALFKQVSLNSYVSVQIYKPLFELFIKLCKNY
jgi:hypothetical protein